MDLLRLGHKASLELDLNSELIGNKDREIFVWMRRRRKCSLSPNIYFCFFRDSVTNMHQLSSKFRKIFAKIFSSQISKREAPYEDISSRGKAELFVHLYFYISLPLQSINVLRQAGLVPLISLQLEVTKYGLESCWLNQLYNGNLSVVLILSLDTTWLPLLPGPGRAIFYNTCRYLII